MKAYGGVEVCLYSFLTSPIGGGEWLVSFTPWLLYPEYPLNRKLGEPHSWSRHFNKEKNLFLSQELNHNSLVFMSVT